MLHFAASGRAGRADRADRAGPVRSRVERRRRLAAVVGASLLLAGLSTGGAAAAADPGQGRVVVVGVAGLRWADVSPVATPALWGLAQRGAIGTLTARSARSAACPADGWLALSAGARAADVPTADVPTADLPAADLPAAADGGCRTLTDPAAGGPVPGWLDYLAAVRAETYGARLGSLGSALRAAGIAASGFGPGAAIALADPAGAVVGDHHAVPTDPTALHDELLAASSSSRLVVIDAGVVRDVDRPPGSRADQVALIESRVAAALGVIDEERARSGADPTFLLVSLADGGTTPQMQLAAALGPATSPGGRRFEDALLGTSSTRQPAILQVTDVAPTIVAALGLPQDVAGGAFVGSPFRVDGSADASGGSAAHRLSLVLDIDRHASAAAPLVAPFFGWLFGLLGVLALLVVAAMARRLLDRPGTLRGLQIAGVALAAVPVASLLANAAPWWRAARPGLALTGLVVAGVAGVAAVALGPPWRRWTLGPVGVVAAVTTVVIAADVVAGARLQVSAVMGVQPLVAGRFYGFGNSAFAVFATSALLLAAALAGPLVRRRRRSQAAAVVIAIGLVATVLDGTPGLGSDFGGPTALFAGFAVLALLAAGIRLTWTRVVGVLLAGVAIVGMFAVADWLRPADTRTHLGRFVQTVLDGGLWPIVRRKLGQNLGPVLSSWPGLLALAAAILIAVGVWRTSRRSERTGFASLGRWFGEGTLGTLEGRGTLGAAVPLLRPVAAALGIALGIGFLVNDSGIAIPAIGLAVALPLLIAAGATWLLERRVP